MLKVFISNKNIPEKRYIINTLISEFLGLEYSIEIHNTKDYLLKFSDSQIIIKDSFWGENKSDEYLITENIPQKINFLKNELTDNINLPILYGTDSIVVEDKIIKIGLDIFASSFFMLTRWEEYVNNKRDNLDRFPGKESIAFKNNFNDRPIVNEYVEFLWNILKHWGYKGDRRKKLYTIFPTVDVDHLFSYNNFFQFAKKPFILLKNEAPTQNITSTKNKTKIKKAWEYFYDYYKIKLHFSLDPSDTYNKLMNKSELNSIKTYFFFLSGSNNTYDVDTPLSDKRFNKILNVIKSREHYIGFHPGFDTYNNIDLWKKAKNNLDRFIDGQTKFGRQHYLRFNIPNTWQIWEENNMEWDSTLGYSDITGFRCGCCYEFSVFNVVTRKQLKLKEYPLLIMDVALFNQGLSTENAKKNINIIKENVKKFNGNFVFLWHNSSFNVNKWKEYESVYEELWL